MGKAGPILLAALFSTPCAHATEPVSEIPYELRDGVAEAREASEKTAQFWLYTHAFNTRVPGQRTPGLKYCDSRNAPGEGLRDGISPFLPLPAADWGEGMPVTGEWAEQAEVAVRFARAYNLEMYRLRRDEIRRACPRVELEAADDQ